MPRKTQGPAVTLARLPFLSTCTLGALFVDGTEVCKTLELPWLNNHPQTSCVPAGTYAVEREYSPHFDRDLWELKGVPDRSECKIHPANRPEELRGCIAPGMAYADFDGVAGPDGVASSKAALAVFDAALARAVPDGDWFELTIVDAVGS